MLLMLLLSAALQAASPAAAPQAGAPKAPAAPAAAAPATDPVADQFICRNEMVTGSRFPQKVCRRKSELAQKSAEDQARIRQMQRGQYSCQMSVGAASC
jgi:hypothetical protein